MESNIKLEELILDLRFFKDVKNEMGQIGTLLKDHLMLKKLDIDLEGFGTKSDKQPGDPFAFFTNLETLKNLKSFRLGLAQSDVDNSLI